MKDKFLAETHEVFNQARPLENYNMYINDKALTEAVKREGGLWGENKLKQHGIIYGKREIIESGFFANENKPLFYSHDTYGNRIDEVRYHPSYHQLMELAIREENHCLPWTNPKQGAHVVRAANYYLQAQVESGHGCPITMTFSCFPTIMKQENVAKIWLPLIKSKKYNYQNIPYYKKEGLTIGMAMTEKQGGSDVRANKTKAYSIGESGPGKEYELVGHKYFVSAPMSDAFLTLAYINDKLSCFLVPRWRPDGTKNPMQIQRLKNKMGNVSNASSETELRGAYGVLIGGEGKGVSNVLNMVALTRFDCMIGSSANMRQAISQALNHCYYRKTFGKKLIEWPLMQNVLADLILESEGALAITMRMARALDQAPYSEYENLLLRLGVPVGKYWICKRAPGHTYEAMECVGGSGVMEDCIMPRLYRESPINTIWEGSGNIQCLDVLRSIERNSKTLEVFFEELDIARGQNKDYDNFVDNLKNEFNSFHEIQYRSRFIVEKMARAFQASVLLTEGPSLVANAFCSGRLGKIFGYNYGNLPLNSPVKELIERAMPF
jgi:putative acyl-CoA dehydrogenase